MAIILSSSIKTVSDYSEKSSELSHENPRCAVL